MSAHHHPSVALAIAEGRISPGGTGAHIGAYATVSDHASGACAEHGGGRHGDGAEGCLAAVSARPRTPLSGRPPGGLDGQPRTERVVMYLSAGELAAVRALAEHAGKPTAVLAREAILELAWLRRGVAPMGTPDRGC